MSSPNQAGQLTYTPVPPDWHVTACDWIMGDGAATADTPLSHILRRGSIATREPLIGFCVTRMTASRHCSGTCDGVPKQCTEALIPARAGVDVSDAAKCVTEVLRAYPTATGTTAPR